MLAPIRTLLAVAGLLSSLGARAEEVITLTSGEWLPYISEKSPHHGPISRIVSAAFALEGVRVNYVFRPWSRAYAEADTDSANGSIAWSTSKRDTERNQLFSFSDAVFDGRSVFFHLKSHPFRWRGDARLVGQRIGGTAGYEYRFDKNPKIKIDRGAASDELNFRKLVAGRFDLLPANLDVGRYILRHELSPEQAALVTWHPRPYNVTRYHLMLNKRNAANRRYLALFNHGLKRLKESGKYAQYMQDIKNAG